jgi:hypothetical protein
MHPAAKTALLVTSAFLVGVLFTAAWVSDFGPAARMLADMKQELAEMREAQTALEQKVRMTEHAEENLLLAATRKTATKSEQAEAQAEEPAFRVNETAEQAEARRLANIFVASSTMATGVGCFKLTATSNNLDMSAQDCSSKYCPDCFYFAGSADQTLTMSNCHTSKWTQSGLAMGSDDLATAVRQYSFVNQMTGNKATISDGTNTFIIPSKGSAIAFCTSEISNTLHFPYNANTNGCPTACDAETPNDISGTAFSSVKHPSVSISCGTSITYATSDTGEGTGSTATTNSICTSR